MGKGVEPVAVVRLARFSQRFLYAASACNGVRSRLKYILRTAASEDDLRSVEESSRSSTESALSSVTHNFDNNQLRQFAANLPNRYSALC